MSDTVLVTGGFGLVGSATVRRLAELGRRVVATDLDTPANRKAAAKLPSGVEFRWADLTDAEQVQRLVSDVAPNAIIHLAAIIAPAIYPIPEVARRVNVDATANLVRVSTAPKRRTTHSSVDPRTISSPSDFWPL
jgi:nucleoside-diphosphate-sugar epimerase